MNDTTFDACFARLLGHEGVFADHPADPGGKTRYGVTEAVARFYGYTGDMRELPLDFAKVVYKKMYWDKPGIVNLAHGVRFDVFDGAVNSGPEQSVKWLQRALDVADDGVIGPLTIKACELMPAAVVVARYNGHRLAFLTRLKTWTLFGAGWAKRLATNLQEV